MTSIKLNQRNSKHAHWAGRCRRSECGRTLSVDSEPWQSKIEVLSELRYHPAREHGHLHGRVSIYGYSERGGE